MYTPIVPLNPDENEQSVFKPKRHKNPTLWGGIYLYGLYKGVPPRVLTPFMIVETQTRSKNGCRK